MPEQFVDERYVNLVLFDLYVCIQIFVQGKFSSFIDLCFQVTPLGLVKDRSYHNSRGFPRGMISIFSKFPISVYCHHRFPFPSRSQPFIISMLNFQCNASKCLKQIRFVLLVIQLLVRFTRISLTH